MDNNINSKTSPDQMRILMKRMRVGHDGKFGVDESPKKELSMRDMLKITRRLNEDIEDEEEISTNRITPFDQKSEEEKFNAYFDDMNVDIDYEELIVKDNLIIWGGTIDGVIQFVYTVTPEENTSGIQFSYLPNFVVNDPDNDKIIKKIESYYNNFYKYFRNNILQ
jgi:hypothetical protein